MKLPVKKITLGGILFICSHFVQGQSVQLMNDQIKNYLNTYYTALETSDADLAIAALTSLIQADPNFPHYYGARASVRSSMNGIDPGLILEDLNMAVSLDSFSVQWLEKRAAFCQSIGTDKMRYVTFMDNMRMIEKDSTRIQPYLEIYPILKAYNAAKADSLRDQAEQLAYAQAVREPNNAEHWYRLAQIYMLDTAGISETDITLALSYLEKAIALDPLAWEYVLFRAHLYDHFLQNKIAAAEDYQFVLSITSTPEIYAALIRAYDASGERDKALRLLETALIIFPKSYVLEKLDKQSGK